MNKLTLLYIEDEHADRLLFARLIGIAGAGLGVFIDVQCVSAIRDLPEELECDAVLLDLSLANGGTISSIEWVRQHHQRLDIFVLSGHPENGDACRSAGAIDFFYKPAFIEDAAFFVNKIKTRVEQREGAR